MKILPLFVLVIIIGLAYLFVIPQHTHEDESFLENVQYEGAQEDDIIYAEEVESADECTSFEKFDGETSECYFVCETEEKCEEILTAIDAEIDALGDEYDAFSENFIEFDGEGSDVSEDVTARFSVEPGENIVRTEGAVGEYDDKIIAWFAAISPDRFSDTYVRHIMLYNEPGGDTAAFVEPSPDEPKWDVYVNIDTMKDGEKEMIFTLIHEFAHILTLNASQMEGDADESCATYRAQEGCLRATSYFGGFFNTFWFGRYTEERSQDGVDGKEYYQGNEKQFVSDYAATNPGEDIAESFAKFVLQARPISDEGQGSIADQKIAYFYGFPELVAIRDSVRNALKPFVRARLRS